MMYTELCSFTMSGSSGLGNFDVFEKMLKDKFPSAKAKLVITDTRYFNYRVSVLTNTSEQDREIVKFVQGVSSHTTLSKLVV